MIQKCSSWLYCRWTFLECTFFSIFQGAQFPQWQFKNVHRDYTVEWTFSNTPFSLSTKVQIFPNDNLGVFTKTILSGEHFQNTTNYHPIRNDLDVTFWLLLWIDQIIRLKDVHPSIWSLFSKGQTDFILTFQWLILMLFIPYILLQPQSSNLPRSFIVSS